MVTLQDFVQHLVSVVNKRISFFEILLHGRWFSSNIYEREAYLKTMHNIYPGKPNFSPAKFVHDVYFILNTRAYATRPKGRMGSCKSSVAAILWLTLP